MRKPSRTRMRWGLVIICLTLVVVIAGCGDAGDPGEFARPHPRSLGTPTPTAAPSSLPVHTISLGDFMASAVVPGPHGLLLYGNPKSEGKLTGLPGGTTLYYFDFGTGQSRLVAQAAPAPTEPSIMRAIDSVATTGDWVVVSIDNAGFDDYWEIWAINVVTGARQLMDSYQQETGSTSSLQGFAVDGQMLLWVIYPELVDGPEQWYAATVGIHTSKQAITLPGNFFGKPYAEDHNTLVLEGGYLVPDSTRYDGLTMKDAGYYLWDVPDGKPQYLLPEGFYDFALNSRYIIWTDMHAQTLTLYDRATGHRTENWVKSCIRPALAPDRPYAVCLDYARRQMMLVHVPTGQVQPLGITNDSSSGAIVNGRAYWVQPAPGGGFGDTVAYVDLPTR